MIQQFFASKRPKPVSYLPPWKGQQQQHNQSRPNFLDKQRADLLKITPEEFLRRDKIVTDLWLDKPFMKGDVCSPLSPKHKEKYGTIVIKDIFKDYHAFPIKEAMEWPNDDEPYTITAEAEKETGLILLHPSWLEKKTYKGASCPTC